MEKYLGVKVINAEPMTAKDFSDLTGKVQPGEGGYKVVYEDGYTSWSTKDVFEKAYRKLDGLTFGLAIEALNVGMKIKVPEWEGYWFKKSGMVMVMTAEGEVLNTPHFQQYIFREDWIAFND